MTRRVYTMQRKFIGAAAPDSVNPKQLIPFSFLRASLKLRCLYIQRTSDQNRRSQWPSHVCPISWKLDSPVSQTWRLFSTMRLFSLTKGWKGSVQLSTCATACKYFTTQARERITTGLVILLPCDRAAGITLKWDTLEDALAADWI